MEEKKKILIIDDDSFLLDMYAIKFSNSNFEVTAILESEKALEKLRSGFIPNIILVDIMMPIMDGFELMEKMKEEKLCTDVPKIILSNRGQKSDIARGEELGAVGYIVKASSTPSEVLEKVNSIMNKLNIK